MKLKSNLSDNDIWQMADLHFVLLHNGFLASLGRDFLYLVYQQINLSNRSTIIVALHNSKVIGFISGGTGLKDIYFRLLKKPLRLARAVLPSLLRKSTVAKLFSLLTRNIGKNAAKINKFDAELYSICVLEQYHGSNVANDLYKELCDYFTSLKIDAFMIVVGAELKRAQRFYKKQGAFPTGSLEQGYGKRSIIFKHIINRI